MPKITEVTPQKKNPHRFNIYLDGQFVFGADENLMVNRRLVVGKELSTSDVEHLIKETEVGKLMERMYRLFSIRQRSEKEVRDYLKNLSFKRRLKEQEEISSFIVDTIVARLKQLKFINDEEFAKAWVSARRKSKQKGVRVLKQELFQKGINKEIIEEVINDTGYVISEAELAKQALEKRMKIWKNLPTLEFKKKAYEFLTRRGFEFSVIKEVVENVLQKR
ncbi:MAG: RecX family transcriptional regulator [Candidatus Daviesbacteria bacterium]|nr:MAG: RecX family transcriptional regulator [Candidatus Daviesbacteria bacterium]